MSRLFAVSVLVLLLATANGTRCLAEEPSPESVNRALKNAVKALRATQEANGAWTYDLNQEEKNVGATALAGLSLMEAGVPANDPAVVKALTFVRAAAPRLTETYALSLVICFLDRAAGALESGTIRTLAGRLGTGIIEGGWAYRCASQAPAGEQPADGGQPSAVADNSNTQFAILALWVARKHQAAVDHALKAADLRFRRSQRPDGSWGYGASDPMMDRSMPTMTCAGLLGVALGYGSAKNKPGYLNETSKGARDIADDPAVVSAFAFLSGHVGNQPTDHPQWLYYLWSLSRVCIALKVPMVGQHDWYAWGAERLIDSQFSDGSWKTKYGTAIDTSFAILFLKRTDLIGDIRTGTPSKPADSAATGAPSRSPPKKPAAERPGVPPPEVDNSPRLAVRLVRASASEQSALIAEYREAKGVDYTLGLATAIPDLRGEPQDQARAALAVRLGRMSVRTLRQYLTDEDRELRRAAATATETKKAKELVPDLIRLLKDSSEPVALAAHHSLKRLTGQDFDRTPAAWEAWWKANGDPSDR